MAEATNTLNVPIVKAKAVVPVNLDDLPDDVYREVMLQGLKVVLNRGMSKITIGDLGDAEKVKEEALLKGNANLEALYEGKIRFTGGAKGSKVSGAVKTEAMRLARNLVKDEIKRQGGKISHYEASEITKAAKDLLEQDDSLLEQAKTNLEARAKIAAGEGEKLSAVTKGIKVSAKKVKAAEDKAAKAKKDKPLSAKQAGMTAKTKPKAPLHA